ncbi:MAG TPA: hypothetical protein VGE66_12420 [Chitinophagaceae bacterium]
MTLHRPDDTVKLSPAVLEDASVKTNHHLLSRILREEMIGTIREQDMNKSTPQAFYYWVSFHYATFLLSEFHIMKVPSPAQNN